MTKNSSTPPAIPKTGKTIPRRLPSPRPFRHPLANPPYPAAAAREILIATPAIRIHRNPHRISHLDFSNRHEIPEDPFRAAPGGSRVSSFQFPVSPSILIATPAIRIRRNPHRISHLDFSNRHEIRSLGPARPSLTSPVFSNLEPRTSNLQFLIGPPVIRICPKSFRMNHIAFSNRLKTYRRPRSVFLATNRSPLATFFGVTNA